jgi:hypothetical protein
VLLDLSRIRAADAEFLEVVLMAMTWNITRIVPLAPLVISGSLLLAFPAWAEDAAAPSTSPPAVAATDAKPSDSPPEAELTAEEKAEKETRKVCKADICSAFRAKQSSGQDIACNVVKSWRKEQLGKLVAKLKVSWPYGPVRCTTAVKISRADIVKAMSEDKLEIQMEKHAVACVVEREKDAATDIKFEFSPTVTFENGKATKAKLNWGN